jgi:cytoskeletal protein CcmA (bactofilin family)
VKKIKMGSNNGNSLLPTVNLINEGTVIEGEIHSKGDLRIDGTLKGIVHSDSKVVIGTSGIVEGNVHCNIADIHGKIDGTITVKDILFLKSSSKIDGDIKTGKLVVETGAMFNGSCSMGSKAGESEKNNEANKKITKQESATVQ